MELTLTRKWFSEKSTIGILSVNNKFFCNTLEDIDRNLDSSMSEQEIAKIKVKGITAIPTGRYEVAMTFSERFQQYMPLLLNVKGFAGIRMHVGNTSEDTEGCILVGMYDPNIYDKIVTSKVTYEKLLKLIRSVEKTEKIYITIVREKTSQQKG